MTDEQIAEHMGWIGRRFRLLGDVDPASLGSRVRALVAAAEAVERERQASLREWPGEWRSCPPGMSDHPQGAELAWVARGYPFNRPVLARSNVGVRRLPSGDCGPFVSVELMADGFHGQQASDYPWFQQLEWLGPLVIPQSPPCAAPPATGC